MRYSFSRLTAFEDCELGWHRNYNLEEDQVDNAWGQLGGFMHKILEKYALGELQLHELETQFNLNKFYEVTEPFPFRNFDKSFQCAQYLSKFKGFRNDVLAVEREINLDIDGRPFVGYIDLETRAKEGYTQIIDHKLSKKFSKADLKKKQRQMYLYSIDHEKTFGAPPKELIFNFYSTGEYLIIPFNKEDQQEAYDWALETIIKIENKDWNSGEFKTSSSKFFCDNLCGFRNNCNFKAKK